MCTQKRGNIYIVSNSSRGCGNNNSNSTNYLKTSMMMMMLPMSESSANNMILSPQRKNSILINFCARTVQFEEEKEIQLPKLKTIFKERRRHR